MTQKKKIYSNLLYDYVYLVGRDHFETSLLCDKDASYNSSIESIIKYRKAL